MLKLTCTADDMIPLAKACDFKGSRGDGVHLWKESERAELRAELDAAYFHLYNIPRPDAKYILSTFTNTGRPRRPTAPPNNSSSPQHPLRNDPRSLRPARALPIRQLVLVAMIGGAKRRPPRRGR